MKQDYIHYIRSKVGHDKVFMNFVVALIENGQGEILLQRRGDTGLWSFIGGCMELGETFEETLRREIREETGATAVEIRHQLGIYNWLHHAYPNGDAVQNIDLVYVCQLADKKALSLDFHDKAGETLDLRWIDPRQLIDLPLLIAGYRRVIADYLDWRAE